MKKFVVFDLDGTLLNTLPDIADSMNKALARFGLPVHPQERYRLFTGDGARKLTQRAVSPRAEMEDAVYREYLKEYARHSRENTAPYEGVPDMLEELQRLDVGMLVYSNKDDSDVRSVVRHYFPKVPFLASLGALPNVPLKPDPRALTSLLSRLKLDAERGFYLGDTVTDMRTARGCALYAIAALWGFQSEEALLGERPDAAIRHPSELINAIGSDR